MKKLFILAISSLVFFSCNTATEKTTEKEEENPKEETVKQEDHKDDEKSETVELNNGAKWVVNEEMKPYVMKGEELLNNYAQTNQTDYKQLAADLKAENEKLIKSCTMNGKSHDELHKWLEPHLKLTKHLEKADDAANAKTLVTDLQSSYKSYHEYFN